MPISSSDEAASRLAHVMAYADQAEKAEAEHDRGTLAVAADLLWLYNDGEWIQKQKQGRNHDKPRKPGSPGDPGSIRQFGLYIESQTRLSPSYTKKLLAAGRWTADNGHLVPTTAKLHGERAVRLLMDMDRRGDASEHQLRQVIEVAADLAAGAPITATNVNDAAKQFWSSDEVKQQAARVKAQAARKVSAAQLEQQIHGLLVKLAKVEGGADARHRIAASLADASGQSRTAAA